MYEQTVERIAHADATRLGIIDNGTSHLEVALFVEISVHHSGTRLDDRNAGSVTYEINQPTSATRDTKINIVIKLAGIAVLIYLSRWGDWPYMGILFALSAHIWHDDKSIRWTVHTLICLVFLFLDMSAAMRYGYPWWAELFQAGTLMVAPMLIFLYNGESGSKKPFHKWFFYVFYPLHMLVLWALRFYVIR